MPTSYKCIIAEDSLLDRDVLEMYIARIEQLELQAVCSNGLEAAAALQANDIDLVFSDIDMPGLSGLELKQSLPHAPVFIFISSFAEYAAESYNLDVIDFIVKPVSFARLLKAVHKAIDYIELKTNVINNDRETATDQPANTNDHFYIREDNGFTRINTTDLLFVESMGNFSRLQTRQQTKHMTLVSLKNIEEQLPQPFFMRVHKQYIINLQHIVSINSAGEVIMAGGETIPVGAVYRNSLMKIIQERSLSR
jgi:two-component system LytT family response regulator